MDKDGLTIEDEAKEILPILFRSLASLPDWGSARDVYETIYTGMYGKRASRVGTYLLSLNIDVPHSILS